MSFLVISVFLVTACNTRSIENRAKRQLKQTIQEVARNPDTYKISDLALVYKSDNDSAIVYSFRGKGQNGFGGYSSSRYEYYYYIAESADYEYLVDINNEEPFINSIKHYYETAENLFNNEESYPEEYYSYIDDMLTGTVAIRSIAFGRTIKH
jgi:hypothetical protein